MRANSQLQFVGKFQALLELDEGDPTQAKAKWNLLAKLNVDFVEVAKSYGKGVSLGRCRTVGTNPLT